LEERSLAMKEERFEGGKHSQSLGDDAEKQAFEFIEENAPKRITVEQLRKYKGFENVSEEEANNIVETLYQLAVIAYYCYMEQENNKGSEAA